MEKEVEWLVNKLYYRQHTYMCYKCHRKTTTLTVSKVWPAWKFTKHCHSLFSELGFVYDVKRCFSVWLRKHRGR